MIRSNFAITRLIVLPYGVLLLLYLLVVGGGGAWLYYQVQGAEVRILMDEVLDDITPLARKLEAADALSQGDAPWLLAEVEALFDDIPALQRVSVKGRESGFQLDANDAGAIVSHPVAPLPQEYHQLQQKEPAQRLYAESEAVFLVSFDVGEATVTAARLDFGFDRGLLLARIDRELGRIRQAVMAFALAGGLSILLALLISLYAMRATRRIEGHFQEIYQRASLTEMAASLVHDLRNPLMALRTNARALLIAPEDAAEIAADLDRDIVTLNDKLSAFLDLTRCHDDAFAAVDVAALIDDVVRLAQPVLTQQGLGIDVDLPPDLPRPHWQKSSLQDALLNVVLNAAQSGQTEGDLLLRVRQQQGQLEITVEDQGRGIAPEDLPHLFEAFYTTREQGNGLGLAIVQRVVAAHHGEVEIANRPQGGVRVTLRLPIQRQETPEWWKKLKRNSPI